MNSTIINDNLLNSKEAFIAHQVNCKGAMDSGVALEIKRNFPETFKKYQEKCEKKQRKAVFLGEVLVNQEKGKTILNLFAQNYYGDDGTRYTNYEAFYNCLETVEKIVPEGEIIAFPYKIGCGRGHGDWAVICSMFESVMPSRKIVFYKIEE